MNNELTATQINHYQKNGFVVIENFLDTQELQQWQGALDEAIQKRNGNKMPDRKEVFEKGDDADKAYFENVLDQL